MARPPRKPAAAPRKNHFAWTSSVLMAGALALLACALFFRWATPSSPSSSLVAPPGLTGRAAAAALTNQGNAVLVTGDLSGAAAMYREALDAYPRHLEANYALGLVVQQLGIDTRAAEMLFRRTLKLSPAHAAAHSSLGDVLMDSSENRTAEALATFTRALALNPASLHALNNLGTLYRRLGRNTEAQARFEAALAVDAECNEARINLGTVLKESGDLDAALEAYVLALARDPTNAEANYNAALVLISQHRPTAAVPFLTLALAQRNKRRAAVSPAAAAAALEGGGEDERHQQHRTKKEEGAESMAAGWRDGASLDDSLEAAEYLLAVAQGKNNPSTTDSAGRRAHVRGLFDGYASRFESHLVNELGYRAPPDLYQLTMGALADEAGEAGEAGEAEEGGAGGEAGGGEEASLRASLRVVDLGCGTGLAGALFKNVSSYLAGGDLSPNMVSES